ncbi:MAG: DUF4856 domain-containing protein [Chitinophagaceae bacterium]|nr:DUF4856 domain-containing protein [Chitinophagaceae bacterium]
MRSYYLPAAALLTLAASVTSCKKDKNTDPDVKAYTVPTTYNFGNANYTSSTQRIKMAVELDTYLKTANTGSTLVPLDKTKADNLWNNANNPYSDASLNTSGINIITPMANASLFKSYVDSSVIYNNGTTASQGTGGFVPRGTNKIIVGPRGLEYSQAYTKGVMGSLFFKEAMRLLASVKAMDPKDTATAQAAWDEAFGYLAVPADYDTSKTYTSTDANRPLLWGGYLAERGKSIQAGGIIFSAFLKGRAAIGAYDKTVRNAQADTIMAKWEQLAAASALAYVTSPTASSAIGNLGTQFHALSEGLGFILALQYRSANSKLSAADFTTLNNIIHKDFYELINQTGFTDLTTAQNILKNTYGL